MPYKNITKNKEESPYKPDRLYVFYLALKKIDPTRRGDNK
jgi:hypothetical protein